MNPIYYFVLIPIMVFFIVFYYISDDADTYWLKPIKCLFASTAVGGFIGGIILLIVMVFTQSQWDTQIQVSESYELKSLDTYDELTGKNSSMFFVGSGFVGEHLYYHFFYQTNHGIKYNKVRSDSNNFYIVETTGTPTYKIYHEFFDIKYKDHMFYDTFPARYSKSVLEIPKGTVKSNFKVN